MTNKKVLISPSSFGKCGREPIDLLLASNFEIIENPYSRKLTESEVIELGLECVGIIAGVEPLTSKVLSALPKLRCISRVGVGMDNIDLEYADSVNIKVFNTPDGPSQSVAELTVGLVFALLRKIPQAHSNITSGIWKKEIGNLLQGKKIGIVGLGRIGKLTSRMFISLGNNVCAYDLYPDLDWAEKNNVEIVSLSRVCAESDIICIHVPGNKDKSPVVSQEELSLMKSSAFIINVSRGGVVDEVALYDALKLNRIAGAALDVFQTEPYEGPLIQLDNIILTPHLGSYALEGKLKMEVDAVINFLNTFKND